MSISVCCSAEMQAQVTPKLQTVYMLCLLGWFADLSHWFGSIQESLSCLRVGGCVDNAYLRGWNFMQSTVANVKLAVDGQ